MAALQLRRGLKANLPATAAIGEPLIATDTRELFIGTGTSTYKIGDVVFAAAAPVTIEPEKVWVNTTTNTIYRASDDATTWVQCGGVVDLSGLIPKTDIATEVDLGGVTPLDTKVPSQKAVKTYVDNAVSAIKIPQEWPDSVIDEVADPPVTPAIGDRYLVKATATGAFAGKEAQIAQWDGAAYVFTVATVGTFLSVDTFTTGLYYFGGVSWTKKNFELTTGGPGIDVTNGVITIAATFAGTGLEWDDVTGVLSVGTLDGGTF